MDQRSGALLESDFCPENGLLPTGRDCPYFDSDPVGGRAFRLLAARNPDSGVWTGQPIGFQFNGARCDRKN